MKPTVKCCATVTSSAGNWGYGHTCERPGSLEHEGKHYCKIHHPPAVKARRMASAAKYDARRDAELAAWEASTKARELLELKARLFDTMIATGNPDATALMIKFGAKK